MILIIRIMVTIKTVVSDGLVLGAEMSCFCLSKIQLLLFLGSKTSSSGGEYKLNVIDGWLFLYLKNIHDLIYTKPYLNIKLFILLKRYVHLRLISLVIQYTYNLGWVMKIRSILFVAYLSLIWSVPIQDIISANPNYSVPYLSPAHI